MNTDVDDLNPQEISRWRCEFKSPQLEQAYLIRKLPQDKKISQFLTIVIAVVLALILLSDELIIKPEYWPQPALTWRVGLLMFSLVATFLVPLFKSVKQFQVLLFTFVVIFLVNLQLMVLIYKDYYVLHLFFDVTILIVIYFSTLFSFKVSCVIGICYAFVGSTIILNVKIIDSHTTGMVIVAYTAANLVGIVISNQEHKLRRNLYLKKIQLREIAEKMKSYAFSDSLTNIPNRRSFDDRFESYQKSAARSQSNLKQVAVVVSDIDYFKRVNDTYGHDVGDIVLVKFSQFIAESIRPTDAVYRFGGEEFVIILLDCTQAQAKSKINDLIKQLNDDILNIDEINYPITASFGLAFLQPNETAREVIARADKVLYHAKENGRNQLCIAE
ncbi:GGDEF domain-containing protein [Pseudoalteromonas haloplanktis]|uniref:diguanylate cyclase n=1 Tax=Pseudoalteromonas haloplanktis TaxID=228 RepID=A0ABU1BBW2_PSEHA|nr:MULTISPECIES: GGDEF domain-containing protein [Pseudoalteromonas]MDQ9091092.1 GGDEF domain-containing protein [Pseudoalteromonas haloplanktis]BDF93498.1 hypothetical protein KAN5_03360 [Pseudoalteromonas sp. KAN5]